MKISKIRKFDIILLLLIATWTEVSAQKVKTEFRKDALDIYPLIGESNMTGRGGTNIERWQIGYIGKADFNLYEQAVVRILRQKKWCLSVSENCLHEIV